MTASCPHWAIVPSTGCRMCNIVIVDEAKVSPLDSLCRCGHTVGDHDSDSGMCVCSCPAWRPAGVAS